MSERPKGRSLVRRGLDLVSKPTDVQIVDRLLENGQKMIFSVPCSVTDTIDQRWRDLSEEGKLRIFYATHEHVLAGMAQGYYLGSGELPLIHMQNSGLTNAADGIISSAGVYKIPVLAMVTWRGCNDKDDSEPHQAIGTKTKKLTETIIGLGKSFGTRLGGGRGILGSISKARDLALTRDTAAVRLSPQAFVKEYPLRDPKIYRETPEERSTRVNRITETKGRSYEEVYNQPEVSRKEALELIVKTHPDAAIIHANGYNARAAQHFIDRLGNFYEAGYMGGAIAIGWGMAVGNPDIEVVVVDGDANALMSHMNPNLFAYYPRNLNWYILDNGISASVGTSPSVPLTPEHNMLAKVINTIPEKPGEFEAPRVGKKGIYFDDISAVATLERVLGEPLPMHAQRFRKWVENQTEKNIAQRQANSQSY